MGHDMHELN